VTSVIADAAVGPIAPPLAATVVAPIERLQNLSPLALREAQFFKSIAGSDASITITPGFGPTVGTMIVEFSDNDVDLFIPTVGSLWALAILDLADLVETPGGTIGPQETTNGMLTLTGNKLRNAWPKLSENDPAFNAAVMVNRCAATGNVIQNRGKAGKSLWINVPLKDPTGRIVNVARAAVTGNVLIGPPDLPPRTPTPPGLPDWKTYNDCT
jgi:hypothetical protein